MKIFKKENLNKEYISIKTKDDEQDILENNELYEIMEKYQ